jgi:DNA-binding transcriptional LysR family regulator
MLTPFRIFADLVEAGSFARAAESNFVTRSAVSQRIQQLEETLGNTLLVRARTGVTPTEAGAAFYRACRDMLDRYEELRRELDELRDTVEGLLRVGAVTSVGLHGLPSYLKTYLERHPAVDVALEYLTHQDVYRGIRERTLDLGIVAYPDRRAGVVTIPYQRDQLAAIVPPQHSLACVRTTAPDRLDGEPFVAFERGTPTGRAIEGQLRRAGVRVRVVHRFENVETIKRAVEIGAGVSIVPSATAEHEVASGTLARVRLRGEGWWRPLAVVHRKDRPPGRAAQAFLEILASD